MSEIVIDHSLHFDGGANPNPGFGGCGWVIRNSQFNIELQQGGKVVRIPGTTETTNNQAEYVGLIEGLKRCRELGITAVNVYGDSSLVINQVTRQWRCNEPILQRLLAEALTLASSFRMCVFELIPRAQNSVADALASHYVQEASATPAQAPEPLVSSRRRPLGNSNGGRGPSLPPPPPPHVNRIVRDPAEVQEFMLGGGGGRGLVDTTLPERGRGGRRGGRRGRGRGRGQPDEPGGDDDGDDRGGRGGGRGGRGGRGGGRGGRGGSGGGRGLRRHANLRANDYSEEWLVALESLRGRIEEEDYVITLINLLGEVPEDEQRSFPTELPPAVPDRLRASARRNNDEGRSERRPNYNSYGELAEEEDDDEPEQAQPQPGRRTSQVRYLLQKANTARADIIRNTAMGLLRERRYSDGSTAWQQAYAVLNATLVDMDDWRARLVQANEDGSRDVGDNHQYELLAELLNGVDIVEEDTKREKNQAIVQLQHHRERLQRMLNPLRGNRDEARARVGEERWLNNPAPRMDYATRIIMLQEELNLVNAAIEVLEGLELVTAAVDTAEGEEF